MSKVSSIFKKSKFSGRIVPLILAAAVVAPAVSHGGYLFTGDYTGSRENFIAPNIDYKNTQGRYSEWDVFYSRYSVGNLPDVFAPFGGVETGGLWYPTPRPDGDSSFPWSGYYSSDFPNAFWDINNPIITQVGTDTARVTGGGNIYSWTENVTFRLDDNTTLGSDGFNPGLVVFQFQTDGALVDFANIKLIAHFGGGESSIEISATDLEFADYLREYQPSAGSSEDQFTGNGYRNRVAIQWDLSGITTPGGDPVVSYTIEWGASAPSMSLQQVYLENSDTFTRSIASHRAWRGGDGLWSDGANWFQHGQGGGYGSGPEQNGNVRFENTSAANIVLSSNHTAGELIFTSSNNVTLSASNGAKLTVNTGISTSALATGTYTINSDYVLGSLNLFEIKGGTVVLGGVVSGNHGVVKTGSGSLVLAGDNTFTGSLLVDDGTLRVEGNNQYSGGTTLLNGKLVVAADALVGEGALGTNSDPIVVGADSTVYQHIQRDWSAEFQIDGAHEVGHEIHLAAGNDAKILSAINTGGEGAEFSGAIRFTTPSADSTATESAAGNVTLQAVGANDRLKFSSEMTGGSVGKTVTIQGQGTVVYTGVDKSYHNATNVSSGTLLLETAYSGSGAMLVSGSGRLIVDGSLDGSGALTLADGAKIGGSGTINRSFTVQKGTVLSPGNSPGTLTTVDQTWGGGGVLLWEMNDATGTAGEGWDYIDIQGGLNITATTEDRFVLSLNSLTLANLGGEAENFENGGVNRWLILSATDGITWSEVGDFSSYFFLDQSGFALNDYGVFGIELFGDNEIYLTYTVVPEPSTWVLTGFAAAAGILQTVRRRRRQKNA